MKKRIEIIFWIIGIVGMPFFLVPFLYGIHGLGTVTGIGVCLFLMGWAYILRKEIQIPKWISYCIRSIFLILLTLTMIITCFMGAGFAKKETSAETLLVLGCSVEGDEPSRPLLERLQTAQSYLLEHPNSIAILSGGQGSDEKISEAEGMYRWLVRNGIAESRLIKEDQSTSTLENIVFSKAIMEERGMSLRVNIVTNEFHKYRAICLAEDHGLQAGSLPAHTIWYAFPCHYVRELYAILAYWIGI